MGAFFVWHFVNLPRRLFEIGRGFFNFVVYYFGLEFNLSHLLMPWHRQTAFKSVRGLDVGEWLRVKVFNGFGRIIGGLFRLGLVVIGSVAAMVIGFGFIALILIWWLLPLEIMGLIFTGLFT